MSISIIQEPLSLTPTNAQHAYNFYSTNYNLTDFRYVIDIWINPYQANAERVARLKIAPNSSGRGIVEISDIIRNYIKGNPRSSYLQYNSYNTGASTPNGLLTNTISDEVIPSNEYNINSAYEYLPHVSEYRVLIGEQYLSGNTTITNVCNTPNTAPSTFEVTLSTGPASYGGEPNTINVSNAGINIPSYGDGGLTGWSYIHYTLTPSFTYSALTSGTTTAYTGSYTAVLQPSDNDILEVTETYSGIKYTYYWNCSFCETNGWNLISVTGTNALCLTQPGVITIWPGVQDNKTNFNYNNYYWSGTTDGTNNFKYYQGKKYLFVNNGDTIDNNTPAQFLSTFGDTLYTSTLSGDTTFVNNRVRRRNHHYQCPILVPYFWGMYPSFTSGSTGGVYCWGDDKNQPYQYVSGWTNNFDVTNVEPSERIVYFRPKIETIEPQGKLALWAYNHIGEDPYNYLYNGVSEVIEYYFYGDECLSDPIHFLFLNQQGVWDTWTFDKKNIKTYNKNTKTYAQGTIRDNSVYNPFFYDKRAVIYDSYQTESVEAQSMFMDENDRKIVEEIFLSTDVYLIKEHYYNDSTTTPYSLTPYLIPIVITSKSLQEYKRRYNKVYQYTLSFEYNPNQLLRTTL